jgi:4-hydroxyphenylpyruvate dioxygenase
MSDAEFAELRDKGIHERDGSGEFFQVYTADLFGAAIFFEIVERRGGYRGFGASNAPIRLAAQTLLFEEGRVP